jgi:hypothetical protein
MHDQHWCLMSHRRFVADLTATAGPTGNRSEN